MCASVSVSPLRDVMALQGMVQREVVGLDKMNRMIGFPVARCERTGVVWSATAHRCHRQRHNKSHPAKESPFGNVVTFLLWCRSAAGRFLQRIMLFAAEGVSRHAAPSKWGGCCRAHPLSGSLTVWTSSSTFRRNECGASFWRRVRLHQLRWVIGEKRFWVLSSVTAERQLRGMRVHERFF